MYVCICNALTDQMTTRPRLNHCRVAMAAALLLAGSNLSPALAFPPYRSTDADTADPHSIELRTGVQTKFENGEAETLFPSVRLNLGLPGKFELNSEFDLSTNGDGFDDGALGAKWIPFVSEAVSVGFESLALLPIRMGDGGVGTETQILTTIDLQGASLHLNAGGVYDPRGTLTEKGWRASGLLEIPMGNSVIGIELFAKDTNLDSPDARIGAGIIYDAGGFDVRFGIHAGLTRAAPDAVVSLWICRAFSLL